MKDKQPKMGVKKVLWFTNIPLPEASLLMNRKSIVFGGWIAAMAEGITKNSNIELTIAYPKFLLNNVIKLKGKQIKYYIFPSVKNIKTMESTTNKHIFQIIHDVNPDIVHVFGTEYLHTFEVAKVCRNKNINLVISIQGLISIIAKHYMACLPENIRSGFTFYEFISRNNLRQQQRKLQKKGVYEIKALQKTDHIIGRTTWDKACTTQINSEAQYHFCNETLRDEFYKNKWNIEKCESHSIFISQGSYPIKGLHFMIEAMPLIIKMYPYTKLYIAGTDIIKADTFNEKIKFSSYGRYIKKLINNINIEKHIIFIGVLDEKQMCKRYLESNVFVSPSAIENSPNSLGEAMILGVPSVSSCVGGVQDMIKDREEGFIYPYDEPYMLAHYICEIFKDKKLAVMFSEKSRKRAMITHDREENFKKLIQIYEDICNG
jgi:glycosyltransferase involved in cell wall biosynthesis